MLGKSHKRGEMRLLFYQGDITLRHSDYLFEEIWI